MENSKKRKKEQAQRYLHKFNEFNLQHFPKKKHERIYVYVYIRQQRNDQESAQQQQQQQ